MVSGSVIIGRREEGEKEGELQIGEPAYRDEAISDGIDLGNEQESIGISADERS